MIRRSLTATAIAALLAGGAIAPAAAGTGATGGTALSDREPHSTPWACVYVHPPVDAGACVGSPFPTIWAIMDSLPRP